MNERDNHAIALRFSDPDVDRPADLVRGLDCPGRGKAVSPLNGKDLTGWKLKEHAKNKSHWMVGKALMHSEKPATLVATVTPVGEGAELVNAQGGGVDIYTEEKFGDCRHRARVHGAQGLELRHLRHGRVRGADPRQLRQGEGRPWATWAGSTAPPRPR